MGIYLVLASYALLSFLSCGTGSNAVQFTNAVHYDLWGDNYCRSIYVFFIVVYMVLIIVVFLFVFEKEGEKITETHRSQVVLSETGSIRLDNLKTYSDGEEKYPYFTFHYDNNMVCDVLGAIKYDKYKDSYNLEYIISWGKLTYEGEASQFNHSFFRKGWNYMERGAEKYDSDISQEEFLKIYNKYEGLPDWDTYFKEYDLLA